MKRKVCGGCNFQGDSEAGKQGTRILCLYYGKWRNELDSCKYWTKYSYHMTKDQRLILATELRNRNTRIKIAFFSILAIILAAFITRNKEGIKYIVMGNDYRGAYIVKSITPPTVSVEPYDVSAEHVASGVVVRFTTPDLDTLPDELKYPAKYYLKFHNLSQEEIKEK